MANTLPGTQEFIINLDRFGKNTLSSARIRLYEIGLKVLDKSLVYCPIRTGNLRSTGAVDPVEVNGNEMSVTIHYGSPSASEYAGVVHEDLQAKHIAPTQAKFLELAMQEEANIYSSDLASGIDII